MRHIEPCHCSGNSYGFKSVMVTAFDKLALYIQKHIGRGKQRGFFPKIDGRCFVGGIHKYDESAATDIASLWVNYFERKCSSNRSINRTVSYTHLTLPTILRV